MFNMFLSHLSLCSGSKHENLRLNFCRANAFLDTTRRSPLASKTLTSSRCCRPADRRGRGGLVTCSHQASRTPAVAVHTPWRRFTILYTCRGHVNNVCMRSCTAVITSGVCDFPAFELTSACRSSTLSQTEDRKGHPQQL